MKDIVKFGNLESALVWISAQVLVGDSTRLAAPSVHRDTYHLHNRYRHCHDHDNHQYHVFMMLAIMSMAIITSMIGHAKLSTLKSTHNLLSSSHFSGTLGSD